MMVMKNKIIAQMKQCNDEREKKITNSSELFINIFLIKCGCSYTGSKQNEQEIPYISQIKDNFKGFSTVIYFLEFHYSFNEL